MIVDVSNLDLAALRCYAFFNASQIALAEEYGIECNTEYYETQMHKALAYLFLAENCAANLTDEIFCAIQEFIDDALFSALYVRRNSEDCAEGASDPVCILTITDNVTSCTGGLSINILQ